MKGVTKGKAHTRVVFEGAHYLVVASDGDCPTVLPTRVGWTRYEKSLRELGLDKNEWLNKYRLNPMKETILIDDAVDQILELHNADEGSTFSLYYGNMQWKPLRSVSIFLDLSYKITGKQITKEQATEFTQKYECLLRNEKVVVGTWYNPDDGRTYFDFSVIIQDRNFAIDFGKRLNFPRKNGQ
jgi:hypothetical protein